MAEKFALMEHSPVGPSSGDRWIHCPGSVKATEGMPDISSEYAKEGNFAHYITELARKEKNDAIEYIDRTSEGTPWMKDNGEPFVCDREMVTAVQDFLDYCDQFGEGDSFIELRVTYDAWIENGWGTSDHILIIDDNKTCYVIDFKYGKGIQINAKGNTQLKLYALGVFQDWGELYEIDKFVCIISQPRLNHRDQWEISTEKLLKWADDVVEPAGERVYSDDPEYKAGAWCRWCKIKGVCSERATMVREQVMLGVDDLDDLDMEADELEQTLSNPIVMSDDQLGEAAAMLEEIKAWCKDLEKTLEQRVTAGHEIWSNYDEDGEPECWKIVTGRSNRQWRAEADAEAALKRARLKVGKMYNRKLISPTQAEAVLGKDHLIFRPDADGNTIVVKPQGKPVLVRGEDTREPYRVATDELEDLEDDDDTSWLDD